MEKIFASTPKNPRGIPEAPFFEKVDEFIKEPSDFEKLMRLFQERLQQYKFMEQSKLNAVKSFNVKIPEIQNTLDMCKTLKESKEPFETNYELNDTLYTTAEIQPTEKVLLWLGADVMLEYPIDEAIELLTEKLKTAKENLKISEEDSEFLRENITTMEVNSARLYNWDVEQRRKQRDAEAAAK